MLNPYIGHESQMASVEEHRLVGGRGDGIRLFEIRNETGLELTVSADRCADLARVRVNGVNIGYFAPCGYVAPAFYDPRGPEFLKSFTAGFMTTCGLTAVGSPCVDEGEELPLHGSIGNTPAENVQWERTDSELILRATVRQASLFGPQLLLRRTYTCALRENRFTITDVCENIGPKESPLMTLYHVNIGYPMLSEHAQVRIPADRVTPRNAHAAEDTANCLNMEVPQADYEERCYYHQVRTQDGWAQVGIANPDIGLGMRMRFDPSALDHFTEWKMMGVHEYVLGMEPGNCSPDGRDVMRKTGELHFLKPGETETHRICFDFMSDTELLNEVQ